MLECGGEIGADVANALGTDPTLDRVKGLEQVAENGNIGGDIEGLASCQSGGGIDCRDQIAATVARERAVFLQKTGNISQSFG
nr:hypothetical protein [Rhizobium sp. ACO-34A]